ITKSLARLPRDNAPANLRANQIKASEASRQSIARLVQRTLYGPVRGLGPLGPSVHRKLSWTCDRSGTRRTTIRALSRSVHTGGDWEIERSEISATSDT